jgi:peptidoglycan hydrolase-like protein with peptidoglycan-binding domain
MKRMIRVRKPWLNGLGATKLDPKVQAQVRAAQEVLIALGYNLGSGGADGIAGSKTQAAIKKFREDMGLPPGTGVDAQLITMLPVALARKKSGVSMKPPASTTAPLPTSTITKTNIQNVQKGLIALGYDLGSSGADGIAGSKTQAAIARFRTDMGLPSGTGIDVTLMAMLPVALARKATGTYTSSSVPITPGTVVKKVVAKAKAVASPGAKASSPSMITASLFPEGFSLTSPVVIGGLAVAGGLAVLLFGGLGGPKKPGAKPPEKKPTPKGRGRVHGLGAPVEQHIRTMQREANKAQKYAAEAISDIKYGRCRAALRALGMAQAAGAVAVSNASDGSAWHKVDMTTPNRIVARAEGLFETNCVTSHRG